MASQLKYNCPSYDQFITSPNVNNIEDISQWLIDNVHQFGSELSTSEILNKISHEWTYLL